MIGLVILSVAGCVCLGQACKNASWDRHSKDRAKNNNELYYMDWEGNYRRVDNNNKVLRNMTDWNNGDIVDIDIKTNQMLNVRSCRERELIETAKQRCRMRNIKNKEEAIKEGRLWYSSYEITEHQKMINSFYPFEYVCRRVSDDLLLNYERTNHGVMYDNKFELLLWRDEEQYNNIFNYPTLEKDKEYNWGCIKSKLNQEKYNMTEQEIEKYARDIKAIL